MLIMGPLCRVCFKKIFSKRVKISKSKNCACTFSFLCGGWGGEVKSINDSIHFNSRGQRSVKCRQIQNVLQEVFKSNKEFRPYKPLKLTAQVRL